MPRESKRKAMDRSKEERALCKAAKSDDSEEDEIFSLNVSLESENWNRQFYYKNKNSVYRRNYGEFVDPSILKAPLERTPLHIAAADGRVKCVQMMIDQGRKVNAKDRFHCTALHLAAENGHHECVRALLEAGADCNVPTLGSPGSNYLGGTTALHLAAKYNHVKCVEELLKFSADYNAIDENGHTGLYIAAKLGFDQCVLTQLSTEFRGRRVILSLPSFDTYDTPLHFAVKNRMLECVRQLVRLGSDVNHANKDGFSPMHLACDEIDVECDHAFRTSYYDDMMKILKCFVLEGYKVDINDCTKTGDTPLFLCLDHYNAKMATFLIAYGADMNIRCGTGLTLLENELCREETDAVVLKCVVNRMSRLPRLRSLYASSIFKIEDFARSEACSIWRILTLPENVAFRLVRDETDIYVEMRHRRVPLSESVLSSYYADYNPRSPSYSPSVRYRLEQPLLNLVHERVLDEIKQVDSILKVNESSDSIVLYKKELVVLEKCLWYEKTATNPHSLQQCCRLFIRQYMGIIWGVKYMRKLPLPESILLYLFLDCKEYK